MPRTPVPAFLLTALLAASGAAQNADLTLRLLPDERYNAGEVGTVRAIVTNLGPEAANAAGVRLTKPSARFVGAEGFGCHEFMDSVLCNTPSLGVNESREFLVPFAPPDAAGIIELVARTESFSLDPNSQNNLATATATVVAMADLSLTLSHNPSFRPLEPSGVSVVIREKAALPVASATLLVTFSEPLLVTRKWPNCQLVDGASPVTYRCTFRTFGRDLGVAANFEVVPTQPGPPVTITASVETSEPEWNPADNRASLTAPIYEVYDLEVAIDPPDSLDQNNSGVAEWSFTNNADVPATNVKAEVIAFPGEIDPAEASNGWQCRPSFTHRLECTIASIAPHTTSALRLSARFPSREIRTTFAVNVSQEPSSEFRMTFQSLLVPTVFYRPFVVTNTADSGPGSLRQAILDANALCSTNDANPPCSVQFEIPGPVPGEGWYTIAPRSALPRITVTDFAMDGESQTAFTGDTNPAGPEIFLFGAVAGEAEGLDLHCSASLIRGLAIGGFARNAILSNTRHIDFITRFHIIERNYLGTDPAGTSAVPNGLRGVMAFEFQGEITENVISGNRRSGVFLMQFSGASIRRNRIGIAADSAAPLGNGASGIFVGPNTNAVIQNNVIAHHPDFGVAIYQFSTAEVLENRMFNNVQPGIDIGLDGPSFAGTPRITTAFYDPAAGQTVVEGVITAFDPLFLVTNTAYVYANGRDEAGEELFLGAVPADAEGRFSLRYDGDLTGKYITAMNYKVTDYGDLIRRESSELGPRAQVR